jgi:hypothetical protein
MEEWNMFPLSGNVDDLTTSERLVGPPVLFVSDLIGFRKGEDEDLPECPWFASLVSDLGEINVPGRDVREGNGSNEETGPEEVLLGREVSGSG